MKVLLPLLLSSALLWARAARPAIVDKNDASPKSAALDAAAPSVTPAVEVAAKPGGALVRQPVQPHVPQPPNTSASAAADPGALLQANQDKDGKKKDMSTSSASDPIEAPAQGTGQSPIAPIGGKDPAFPHEEYDYDGDGTFDRGDVHPQHLENGLNGATKDEQNLDDFGASSDHDDLDGEKGAAPLPPTPTGNGVDDDAVVTGGEDGEDDASGDTTVHRDGNGAVIDGEANSEHEARDDSQVEATTQPKDDTSLNAPVPGDGEDGHGIITAAEVPTEEEIKTKQLFKKSAEQTDTLKEAAAGIDGTIHRVDQAIDKVKGSMDKYHDSINGLSEQFGSLHNMAKDMHSEVLSEFQAREASRMCAFENVERMARGEEPIKCDTSTAPSNGDYKINLAAEKSRGDEDEQLHQPPSEQHEDGETAPTHPVTEDAHSIESTHEEEWHAAQNGGNGMGDGEDLAPPGDDLGDDE